MVWDVAIVGGGMSGLVCAVEIKRNYPEKSVVLFERLDRVGKKILATGNGRCNLDNLTVKKEDYNSPEFVSFALESFSAKSNLAFWESLGLLTTSDGEGRIYPKSNTASSVLDVLRFEAERLKIKIVFEKVEKIEKNKYFSVNSFKAENVVLACGGCSSPAQGSDGSGFEIARKAGHKITKLSPSLVQITTETRFVKPLKGLRVKGSLTLEKDGEFVGLSKGEVLFADYGLSGIASMDLSRFLSRLPEKSDLRIYLDAADGMTENEIVSYLFSRQSVNPRLKSENLTIGMLPKQFGKAVIKKCGIDENREIALLTKKDLRNIAKAVKRFEFKVTGTKGFDFSQVTSGGVSLDEVDGKTLMSKKISGLYFCGEILDVDSRCGGFNLHWAVSSARLVSLLKGNCNDKN